MDFDNANFSAEQSDVDEIEWIWLKLEDRKFIIAGFLAFKIANLGV